MRPEARGERNGPSRCDAEDARAAVTGGHAAQRVDEIGLLRRRDERRQIRGDAGLEQRVARHRIAVGVRAEEVDACEPVHLQVDEAGCAMPRPLAPSRPAAVTQPADDLQVARDQAATDEGRLDAESHASSAARMTPSAAASRAAPSRRRRGRAARRSPPSRRRRTPSAPPRRCVGPPVGLADDAPHTCVQLLVGRIDVDHQVAEASFPSRIIAIVESMLSTSFCAVRP